MGSQVDGAAPQPQRPNESCSFKDMENDMPSLPFRFRCSLKDNLTSYLGKNNPFSRPFDPKTDALWLFDNTAYRLPNGAWHAEYQAAFFLKDSGEDGGKVVADIASKLGIGEGDEAEETIRQRVQPFVDTILPARTVHVTVDPPDGHEVKLGASGRSGISTNFLNVPGSEMRKNGQSIQTLASTGAESPEMCMTTTFADAEGWGIISDIDDTIKRTLTASPLGILRTTFATPVAEPIEGMPALYSHIESQLHPAWFYLSASPYNLYPFLRDFREQHFPQGSIFLRDASWMNLAGFLASLTSGTQAYKTSEMEKIHSWLPRRKWICVGDSTQTDPESYAEIYHKFPTWVRKIYIRKVTDVAEMNVADKVTDERFEEAFKGVPREVWRTFDQPQELYAAIDELAN
ncbi:MAG: hypothetical protein M1837_002877 [Sclerophora amabilis]|nr:MAG: hypothetical protein M1837_002877 [Sclerophora amabilis]